MTRRTKRDDRKRGGEKGRGPKGNYYSILIILAPGEDMWDAHGRNEVFVNNREY